LTKKAKVSQSKKDDSRSRKRDKPGKRTEPDAREGGLAARLVNPADGVRSVLVITAHPDDVDFGAAGTVAVMTEQGVDVTYCIVTDGDAGGSDRDTTHEQRATLRQSEQRAAAKEVGVESLIFLSHPDGRVEANLDLRRDLSRVIRQVRPDRVICQSSQLNLDRIYASHPDHLATGEAALCAVYPDARNHFAHPELLEEGLEPHTVPEVWVMAFSDPNVAVETTHVLDRKIAALRSHASQVGDGEHIEDLIKSWGRQTGLSVGLGKKRAAESFRAVDTK
jgi:LmbE family N-acetylglucosaminyl deacetylase